VTDRRTARCAEPGKRRGEVRCTEAGPHPLGEIELRVGALPQQEVGQTLLAAGGNQKVDVLGLRFAGEQLPEATDGELVIAFRTADTGPASQRARPATCAARRMASRAG